MVCSILWGTGYSLFLFLVFDMPTWNLLRTMLCCFALHHVFQKPWYINFFFFCGLFGHVCLARLIKMLFSHYKPTYCFAFFLCPLHGHLCPYHFQPSWDAYETSEHGVDGREWRKQNMFRSLPDTCSGKSRIIYPNIARDASKAQPLMLLRL